MHRTSVPLDLGVEQSRRGGNEVLRAELALEPEQVGAEQPLHDLLAPRDAGEQLVGRERDVVEEADPHVGALSRSICGTSCR